ncbi:MAG TPA: twin-arginine translocase subunit TatC [Rubricoccaceae bacterium]|nr:twin-arginine translocase subunit TatC [Rubricoccaceae bacterium]
MRPTLTTRLKRARAAMRAPASGDGATADPRALPNPQFAQEGEMPFLDHLEELRWRIVKALGGVVLAAGLCLFFARWIVDTLLLGPTRPSFFMYDVLGIEAVSVVLQNRTITGQFFAYFGTVLAAGLILSSPVVVYQLWRFIEPGLYPHERRGLRFAAVGATFFFALGLAFGYGVLTPLALQFFAQFRLSDQILNEFDLTRYFSMVLGWSFGAALLFEFPVVIYFLGKVGIVTAKWLRQMRKYALIVILIVAAITTPPDPMSQIIMAVPLLLLYELSIGLVALIERGNRKREAAEAARASTTAPS